MNERQELIAKITAGTLVALLLFPPFTMRLPNGLVTNLGYNFILDPPMWNSWTGSVDVTVLLLEWIAACALGATLWYLAKTK